MFNIFKGSSKSSSIKGNENVVVQTTINNSGLGYDDVRQISLDVFHANMLQLSEEASRVANSRAEYFVDQLVTRLQQSNGVGLGAFGDPGLQSSLYTGLHHYAKSGDECTESLLIDLLVQRTTYDSRDLSQIVIDEAISVTGKISGRQIYLMALMYLTTVQLRGLESIDQLTNYHQMFLEKFRFLTETTQDDAAEETSHLIYSGCIANMGVGGDYHGYLNDFYGFGFGLDPSLKGLGLRDYLSKSFIPGSEPFEKLVGAENRRFITYADFEGQVTEFGLNKDFIHSYMISLSSQERSKSNIRKAFESDPFKSLFEIFELYSFGGYYLTTVGKTIAKSVIKTNFPLYFT